MQKASASNKDGRGEEVSLPKSPRSVFIPNQINNFDKPIPISFLASQFEYFENSFNDTNKSTTLLPGDCVTRDPIASSNESKGKNPVSRARFHPPILVNTNVQELCKPMEVDLDPEVSRRKQCQLLPPQNLREVARLKKHLT